MTSTPSPAGATRGATLTGLGAIALWSCLALLVARAGAIPPFELAALTFSVGGCLGLVYIGARGRMSALRQPWRVWAVGVGGLFGYHSLYFAALSLAPPAESSLVNYLWPLLIVLFSGLLPGEGLSARHIVGALLGFAGAASLLAARIAGAGGSPLTGGVLAGYGLAFAAAFAWSSYSVLSRRFRGAPTETVAGFCVATAALATLCHLLFETSVAPAGPMQWAAIVALGVGPVGLAFYVWDFGVKHGDIRLLGVAAYATPVLSTLILVAGGAAEATPSLALACALITGGAVVATRRG